MRIGIDARFYGTVGKGLGRYTQKLIENLERMDRHNHYTVFLGRENFEEYRPAGENFSKVLVDCRWYSLKEQLWWPFFLRRYGFDLMHFPHFNVPLFYNSPFAVTIHDLILLHFPTLKNTTLHHWWYRIKFLAYKTIIRSAIKRAGKVIAVSEFTKKDILENYSVSREKVEVIYEGVDRNLCCRDFKKSDLTKKYGIIKPYLLYVGNAYPHKNLEKLALSFSCLKKEFPNFSLVLVGKDDFFYRRLKNFVGERKIEGIIFAGFIPDADLGGVYGEAECYVFPSLYEGFGLPPLEAMLCEIPVISSDHGCMREILGDGACFVDAREEKAIIRGIKSVLLNDDLRMNLKKRGLENVKKYSWERMAEKTLEVYSALK